MSGGPALDLYEILLLLKKPSLCMSVLYYALSYLMFVKAFFFFLPFSDLYSVSTRKQLHLC